MSTKKAFYGTLILAFGLMLAFSGCNNTSKENTSDVSLTTQEIAQDNSTIVYYFHAERRCATCIAVEEVTKKLITEKYADLVQFVSINREKDNNPLTEKFDISGQTLLITNGEEVIDLTNDAFLYARVQPETYQAKLQSVLDQFN